MPNGSIKRELIKLHRQIMEDRKAQMEEDESEEESEDSESKEVSRNE